MKKADAYRKQLEALGCNAASIESLLLRESGLPGPRANLELAAAMAAHASRNRTDVPLWNAIDAWLQLDATVAPTQHPREFLPFCAIQCLGLAYAGSDAPRQAEIRGHMSACARDSRWRMREAAAIAAQSIGEQCAHDLMAIARQWSSSQDPWLLRAALVALAHPPILDEALARFALELADDAMNRYESAGRVVRAAEPWTVLRKALEFAPSVFTAAARAQGFATLGKWAQSVSLSTRKIVAANLRKTRLAKHFPDEVEQVGQALSWGCEDLAD